MPPPDVLGGDLSSAFSSFLGCSSCSLWFVPPSCRVASCPGPHTALFGQTSSAPLSGYMGLHLGPTCVVHHNLTISGSSVNHSCSLFRHIEGHSQVPGIRAWTSLGPYSTNHSDKCKGMLISSPAVQIALCSLSFQLPEKIYSGFPFSLFHRFPLTAQMSHSQSPTEEAFVW